MRLKSIAVIGGMILSTTLAVSPAVADEFGTVGAGFSTGSDGVRMIVATGQRTGVLDPGPGGGLRVVYRCEAAAVPDTASVTFPSAGNDDGFPAGCRLERNTSDDPDNPNWGVADTAPGISMPGAAATTGVTADLVSSGGAFDWRVCWYAYANFIQGGERVPTFGCSDARTIDDVTV